MKGMIGDMIEAAKRHWREFKESKPGSRFQDRYYRRKQSGAGQLSRALNVVVGSVHVIFSTFFGWAPGPGLLTFVIGLAMIGGEFLTIARFLDWSEVRLRVLAHVVGVVWRSSTAGKALIVVVVLSLVAVFGYVIYSVLFAG